MLAKQLFGAFEGALALKGLCMVHSGRKAFPEARKAIEEALAIMEELGLQPDEEYGSMSGRLDDKEVLGIYDEAKAVLNTLPRVRAWYCNADCLLHTGQRTSRIAASTSPHCQTRCEFTDAR